MKNDAPKSIFWRRIEKAITGILIINISLIILFTLIISNQNNSFDSFSSVDSESNVVITQIIQFSQYIFHMIGYTSFAVVILFLMTGILIFLNKNLIILFKPALFILINGFFILILLSIVYSLHSNNTGDQILYRYGGTVCLVLKEYMLTIIGTLGTVLLSLGTVLISIVIITDFKPSSILDILIVELESIFTNIFEAIKEISKSNKVSIKENTTTPITSPKPDLIKEENKNLLSPEELDAIAKAFDFQDGIQKEPK